MEVETDNIIALISLLVGSFVFYSSSFSKNLSITKKNKQKFLEKELIKKKKIKNDKVNKQDKINKFEDLYNSLWTSNSLPLKSNSKKKPLDEPIKDLINITSNIASNITKPFVNTEESSSVKNKKINTEETLMSKNEKIITQKSLESNNNQKDHQLAETNKNYYEREGEERGEERKGEREREIDSISEATSNTGTFQERVKGEAQKDAETETFAETETVSEEVSEEPNELVGNSTQNVEGKGNGEGQMNLASKDGKNKNLARLGSRILYNNQQQDPQLVETKGEEREGDGKNENAANEEAIQQYTYLDEHCNIIIDKYEEGILQTTIEKPVSLLNIDIKDDNKRIAIIYDNSTIMKFENYPFYNSLNPNESTDNIVANILNEMPDDDNSFLKLLFNADDFLYTKEMLNEMATMKSNYPVITAKYIKQDNIITSKYVFNKNNELEYVKKIVKLLQVIELYLEIIRNNCNYDFFAKSAVSDDRNDVESLISAITSSSQKKINNKSIKKNVENNNLELNNNNTTKASSIRENDIFYDSDASSETTTETNLASLANRFVNNSLNMQSEPANQIKQQLTGIEEKANLESGNTLNASPSSGISGTLIPPPSSSAEPGTSSAANSNNLNQTEIFEYKTPESDGGKKFDENLKKILMKGGSQLNNNTNTINSFINNTENNGIIKVSKSIPEFNNLDNLNSLSPLLILKRLINNTEYFNSELLEYYIPLFGINTQEKYIHEPNSNREYIQLLYIINLNYIGLDSVNIISKSKKIEIPNNTSVFESSVFESSDIKKLTKAATAAAPAAATSATSVASAPAAASAATAPETILQFEENKIYKTNKEYYSNLDSKNIIFYLKTSYSPVGGGYYNYNDKFDDSFKNLEVYERQYNKLHYYPIKETKQPIYNFIIPLIIFKMYRIILYKKLLKNKEKFIFQNIFIDFISSFILIIVLFILGLNNVASILFTDLLLSIVIIYLFLFTYDEYIKNKNKINIEYIINILILIPYFVMYL
jgi:hypothetical protein